MKIHCIGSSSSGNCYIVESLGQYLIVELGCHYKDLMSVINWQVSKVAGALVTHRHSDHAAYVPKALEYQIPVYGNRDVKDKYAYINLLTINYRYSIGKFKVQCLEVPHNAPCYAFIIDCPSGERILFATDLSYFKYRVKDCDVIMMESNYDENLVYEALARCEVVRSQNENHLEINDCLEALERCSCNKTQLIILLHLSDGFSDEIRFQKLAHEITGKRVGLAHKGMIYEINESDF